MRRILSITLLLLVTSGCSTTPPQPSLSAGEPKRLDELLPLARQHAAERFEITEDQLRFASLQCRYAYDWPEQDATNTLRWYTFRFFDPDTVEPDPRNPKGVTALGYSIKLTADGQFKGSSQGRGMGWGR